MHVSLEETYITMASMDQNSCKDLSFFRHILYVVLLITVFSCCLAKEEKPTENPAPLIEEERLPEPVSIIPGDCLQELFEKYSADDGRLDQNGFAKLLNNLGLGKVQQHEEEHDDHDDHANDHDDHDDVDHHGDHVTETNTKTDHSTQELASDKRVKRAVSNTTSKVPRDGERETTTVSGKTGGQKGSSGDKSTTTSNPGSVTNGTSDHGFHTDHHQDNEHVTQVSLFVCFCLSHLVKLHGKVALICKF